MYEIKRFNKTVIASGEDMDAAFGNAVEHKLSLNAANMECGAVC